MGEEQAWLDCRISFVYNGDTEYLWDKELVLPKGWTVDKIDGGMWKYVVFLLEDVIPTEESISRVKGLLRKLEAES